MNAASWILALGPFLGMVPDGAAQAAETGEEQGRQERPMARSEREAAPRMLAEILRPETQERERGSRIDELRKARLDQVRERLGVLRRREAQDPTPQRDTRPGAPLPRGERAGRLRERLQERLREHEKDAMTLRMRIRRAVMDGRADGSALRGRLGAREQQAPSRNGAQSRSAGRGQRSTQGRGQSRSGSRRSQSARPQSRGNRGGGARSGGSSRGGRSRSSAGNRGGRSRR